MKQRSVFFVYSDMSIEKKYQKLNDTEHCLRRPGMYLGSVKYHDGCKYIYDGEKMILKEVKHIPGFLKIFDEIISNSVDESKRKDSKLNTIKVNIIDDRIIIWDNGGIPVIKHSEYNEWVPEMVFSNMKAGSNFDDSEDRTTVGTNGVGSTITNIFSKEFSVSTCDGINSFKQVFTNNMSERTKPIIKKSVKNHTEISYLPDYDRFNMDGMDDDHLNLLQKRVYDIAGSNSHLKIYFNDNIINFKSFKDYISLYTDDFIYETDKNWSLGVTKSVDGTFNQVSFVNTTETYEGGSHIDYVSIQIINKLREFFKKKHKVDIKPAEIKNHLFIFLDSTVINPQFSSQTKEKLITEVKDFGCTYQVSDKTIREILKSEIVSSILDWIDRKKLAEENKLARELNKNLSKVKVDKLIDAKGKDRWKCSICIFEGDCLEENTEVRVLRDGDMTNVKMKNLEIDDVVLTHNNRFSTISALTKKINKKVTIKTKTEGDIICSKSHKWFVYDNSNSEFYFIETKDIDKAKHKLVKNYLCFMDSLLVMKSHSDYVIEMMSGQIIETNPEHKLAIYDKENNKFIMVENKDIDINKHLIVNTFKL